MAEVLDSYDFTTRSGDKGNWGQWLDGNVWRLTQGVDFDEPVAKFRSRCYARAASRGLSVQTREVDGNAVVLQASKPPSD